MLGIMNLKFLDCNPLANLTRQRRFGTENVYCSYGTF